MPRVSIATLGCAIFLLLPWLGGDWPDLVAPIYLLILLATPILAILSIREGFGSHPPLRRLSGVLVGVGVLGMICLFVGLTVGAGTSMS